MMTEAEIITEAKERFRKCQDWEAEFRRREREDIKFANGDPDNLWQWEQQLYGARTGDGKPCLTINKVRQHNLQIINDAKQNKPGVNIRPVSDEATFESAQAFEGVVRHIEYQSNAEQAYDTATTFQVEGGIGYWYVDTDYVSDDSFDQEIYVRRIKNPDLCYLDPDINEADGSDARYGFIFEDIPRKEFDRRYPNYKDDAGSSVIGNEGDGWQTQDYVRVAVYYRKQQARDKLIAFVDPNTQVQVIVRRKEMLEPIRELYNLAKELAKLGGPPVIERELLTDDVEWFKIAGNKIIDKGDWQGKYIPIVRVVGEEVIVDGRLDRKGHTRLMKDAQRMYNYWPLSLDTPIPTPSGWTKMGDIEVGDVILDDSGKPTNVRGMSDIFLDRKCYRVSFDDGTHIIADAEHPWIVEERGTRGPGTWRWTKKKITTEEMVAGKHFIEVAKPLELPEVPFEVDPYVLGAWLGDGRTDGCDITASEADAPVMVENLCAAGVKAGPAVPSSAAMRIPIYGLVGKLRQIGVLGRKHIPPAYLRASYSQRLSLLQGLMDTDGGINRRTRQCSFDNTNPDIIDGIVELIRSLGIKAFVSSLAGRTNTFPSGRTYECAPSQRVTFTCELPVFRMARKAAIQDAERKSHRRRTKRHAIREVVEVPSVPVRCVSIDSPSHLFLAGPGMVPTHNTSEATAQVALQTKNPFVAPSAAIEGLETYWANANRTTASVLPYNHVTEDGQTIPAPQRLQPPQMASAYIDGMRICEQQMMMSSGQYQSQFGANENATSGKAINERQRQGDNATYHFIDNLAMAIRFTGKILIDLIPKIYDTERVVRILGKDGSESQVKINPNATEAYQEIAQEEEGAVAIFNPAVGRYDVQSDVGPGYATKRQEGFNAMTQIAAQNKEFMQIAGDVMWRNADFPGADQLAERWAKVIPAHIKGDGPSPEVQQLQGQLQQTQEAVAMLNQKLHNQNIDHNIRGYEATTKRLTAIGNAGPIVTQDQLMPLIRQTILTMFMGPDPEQGLPEQGPEIPMEQSPQPMGMA